ncbi:MAG TPA: hypothetical protein PKD00_00575 [Burkholderiales bacterium]|nr:hypothetical protein [Burkholderiales bacterium]
MKALYKEVANELGLKEEFVTDVVKHMFKNIRKVITSGTFRDVYLYGVGRFRCKPRRLLHFIDNFECLIDKEIGFRKERIERYNKLVTAYYNKLNWKTYGRRKENRESMGKI